MKVQEVKLKYIRLTGHDTCTHEPYRSADTNTMIRRLDLFVLDPPQSSQSESMADLVFFGVFLFFFVLKNSLCNQDGDLTRLWRWIFQLNQTDARDCTSMMYGREPVIYLQSASTLIRFEFNGIERVEED